MKKFLTFVSVAFLLFSCSTAPKENETEISQTEDETIVQLSPDGRGGQTVRIREFEYRGHKYLYMRSRTYYGYFVKSFVHDPDCPCHKQTMVQNGN